MKHTGEQKTISRKPGIGLEKERSLHASIKEWLALPGDRFEVSVDNFIVDIVRNDLLIEIQTKNFSNIRKKLYALIKNHPLQLIYPIPKEKWIVQVGKTDNEIVNRRISPKKGKLIDLFDELVRIPDLINEENFSIAVLMIQEEEIRCRDGKGSWRRKGVSIKDRKLIDVIEKIEFNHKRDFLEFLPEELDRPFSNKTLAKCIGIPVYKARKMTYCLKKMGVIKEVGKNRNELLFEKGLEM